MESFWATFQVSDRAHSFIIAKSFYDQKLHRALMFGIAPRGSSIVLSGGYVDDEDLGDVIIYTGEGGRDPATGRQVADQRLVKGNKSLVENHLNGIPIRFSAVKRTFRICQRDSVIGMTAFTVSQDTGRNAAKMVLEFGGFASRKRSPLKMHQPELKRFLANQRTRSCREVMILQVGDCRRSPGWCVAVRLVIG
jgi:SAD/SRA domain